MHILVNKGYWYSLPSWYKKLYTLPMIIIFQISWTSRHYCGWFHILKSLSKFWKTITPPPLKKKEEIEGKKRLPWWLNLNISIWSPLNNYACFSHHQIVVVTFQSPLDKCHVSAIIKPLNFQSLALSNLDHWPFHF
jgi:hypothetical protein